MKENDLVHETAMMAQLQQLAQFKEGGMLTDAEFSAAKPKLLAL